jgi:hypothetical protein
MDQELAGRRLQNGSDRIACGFVLTSNSNPCLPTQANTGLE